jgi:hypothetical protein
MFDWLRVHLARAAAWVLPRLFAPGRTPTPTPKTRGVDRTQSLLANLHAIFKTDLH